MNSKVKAEYVLVNIIKPSNNLFVCVCDIKTPFIHDIFQTFEVVIIGMKLYQLTKCRWVKIDEF